MSSDYYKILGVEKNATKDEVKKAFHKLAHKHHPDKKGGDEKKFKEINEAYQVLSDDSKRSQYDTYGSNAFSGGAGQGGYSGFNNAGGFDFSDIFRQAGGGQGFESSNVEDIFENFFGGGRSQRTKARRGRDISIDLLITFKESIFGVEKKVSINKVGNCDACGGSGAKPGTSMVKCKNCNGKGKISETKRSFFGSFSTERVCEVCLGQGESPKESCIKCGGEGVLKKNEEINIKVPAGIQAGEMIRFSGRGEAVPGGNSGDLYVKIHIEKDRVFRRDGYNLVMDLEIKLTDSLLGANYNISTLDGDVNLNIPSGISHGEVLKIKNKGVFIDKIKRGDVWVNIKIKIPKNISKSDIELIKKLRESGI
ncbi:MAG: molecular chaperone DnaJ [bacterium]